MDLAKVASLASRKNAVNPDNNPVELIDVKPSNGVTKTLDIPMLQNKKTFLTPIGLDQKALSNGGTSIVVTSFTEKQDDVTSTDDVTESVTSDGNTLNPSTNDKESLWKARRPSSAARWKLVKNAVVAQSAFQHKEKKKKPHRRMQGSKQAIPVLPLPLAICLLICNCLIPGLGTAISGFTYCCIGITYEQNDRESLSTDKIPGLICTNVGIGIAQLFTTTFLLVGWFWSISWGITMVYLAIEHREFIAET